MTTFGRALAVTIINATPHRPRRPSAIPDILAGMVLVLIVVLVLM